MNIRASFLTALSVAASAATLPAAAQSVRSNHNGTYTVTPAQRWPGSFGEQPPSVIVPVKPGEKLIVIRDTFGRTRAVTTGRFGSGSTTTIERQIGGGFTVNGKPVKQPDPYAGEDGELSGEQAQEDCDSPRVVYPQTGSLGRIERPPVSGRVITSPKISSHIQGGSLVRGGSLERSGGLAAYGLGLGCGQ